MPDRGPRVLAVLAGAAAALGLAGCGVPMVITAGSFAADGVSYAASGRSLTDHYISHAMEEDCALHRVLDSERTICVDPEAAEGAEDGAEPPEDDVAGEGLPSGPPAELMFAPGGPAPNAAPVPAPGGPGANDSERLADLIDRWASGGGVAGAGSDD